jgi:hypothetical protein
LTITQFKASEIIIEIHLGRTAVGFVNVAGLRILADDGYFSEIFFIVVEEVASLEGAAENGVKFVLFVQIVVCVEETEDDFLFLGAGIFATVVFLSVAEFKVTGIAAFALCKRVSLTLAFEYKFVFAGLFFLIVWTKLFPVLDESSLVANFLLELW